MTQINDSTGSSRRKFIEIAAGGLGLAIATAKRTWARSKNAIEIKETALPANIANPDENSLLTDPRYSTGAKYRLGRFVGRGADPVAAEAIFRRLPNLDAEPWVAEWTHLAEPWQQKAEDFEKQGKSPDAMNAYLKASLYYSIAKFPVLNHPAKRAAYKKCVALYLKAARYFDPPSERVTIPFEGKEIVGYLRKPKGMAKPPIVIHTGGVDVYAEDWDLADYLNAGLATFRTDMPGAGQCPIWYTPDADRIYPAIINYLEARPDLDRNRMGFIGHSAGGIWGSKMAYVESKRLRAAVNWGGPVHYTFEQPWVEQLKKDKMYLWSILESLAYASQSPSVEEWITRGPKMSLKTQGWLEKPCCPMLCVNGAQDGWVTIDDAYLLCQAGDPKAIRVFPNRFHMALEDPASRPLIVKWLKTQLS
jgi:esterase FrsA